MDKGTEHEDIAGVEVFVRILYQKNTSFLISSIKRKDTIKLYMFITWTVSISIYSKKESALSLDQIKEKEIKHFILGRMH